MERRLKAVFLLFVSLSGLLFSKILYLTLAKNEQYEKAVMAQQSGSLEVRGVRGTVYDRNLIPITERENALWHITDEAKASQGEGNASFMLPSRSNKDGFCAHILGYTSPDGAGLCGIEKKYDNILKSDSCYTVLYTKNAMGAPIKNKEATCLMPDTDKQKDIVLTLDYHIQRAVEDVMDKWVPKGAVVVLDVQSFEVLAMASRPLYDTYNLEDSLHSDKGELLNRALCAYNAGSVFKIVTASSALESNPLVQRREFLCDGSFEYGEKTFLCHKEDGHGKESFFKAFADSCNCAFYETSLMTGGKKIAITAKKFGLGQKLLHMGNEEASGFVPYKTEYTPFDVINLGIGQGEMLITPLQSAVIAATVANGGLRKEVSIARGTVDETGNCVTLHEKGKQIRAIRESTAHAIGAMMRECVLTGTAKSIASSPLEIAGKTGSAETGWLREDGTTMVHGWFCGFFPYSAPKYAVAVLSEDGKSGAKSCVKPFEEICKKIAEIYPLK